MIKVVLLVMYVVNGQVGTFAAAFASAEECAVAQVQVGAVLPRIIGVVPQVFAAACATVEQYEEKV